MHPAAAPWQRIDAGLAARLLPPVLVALGLAAVYARTIASGVEFGDTAELQVKAVTWELPHETGYPAWLLLARPFVWLPIGDVAARLNLFSAVCAVAACLCLYAAARAVPLARTAAAAGAASFGLSATFWSQALVAEVYALNAFCFAAGICLALQWVLHARAAARWLLAVVCAVGAGNHLSFVLFLPLLFAWVVAATPPGRRGRLWGPAALYALLHAGLFALLCTLIADARGGSTLEVVTQAAAYAVGGQFRSILFALPLQAVPARLVEIAWRATRELLPLGLSLAAIGLLTFPLGWRSEARTRSVWLLLLLSGVVNVASILCFTVPDLEVFLIPSWLAMALFVALGFDRVQRGVATLAGATAARIPLARPLAATTGAAILALLVACFLVANMHRNDRSRDHAARAFADAVLGAVGPCAIVVAEWETATPLWYAQRIEGQRPDIVVQARGWQDLSALVAAVPAEQPLYVVRPDEELRQHAALRRIVDLGGLAMLYEVLR